MPLAGESCGSVVSTWRGKGLLSLARIQRRDGESSRGKVVVSARGQVADVSILLVSAIALVEGANCL